MALINFSMFLFCKWRSSAKN